jgi:hypothetical protein
VPGSGDVSAAAKAGQLTMSSARSLGVCSASAAVLVMVFAEIRITGRITGKIDRKNDGS